MTELFVFGVLIMFSSNFAYSEEMDNQYQRVIEKTDSLEQILGEQLKTDLKHNWHSISQSQKYEIENVIDSIRTLNMIYLQNNYSEIKDSLHKVISSIKHAKTITHLVDHKNEIDQIENAIEVLVSINKINQTLKYNSILDSKIYLHNIWEPIREHIQKSTTADDILEFQDEVGKMGLILKYNSKIHENTHSPIFTMVDPNVKSTWNSFKDEMKKSTELDEMKIIAAKYYKNIGTIDSKIISKWEQKITTLQKEAYKQNNIYEIIRTEQVIKNLNMVKKIEKNQNYFDDDSQTKAILFNISENYLKIKSDIKEYSVYLDEKKQMKQKTMQFQNKANDKSNIDRMPEFGPKIKNTLEKVSSIKNALESDDFQYAQQLLNAVNQEWINFERFYPEIRNYTPLYSQHDITTEQKKQIYLDQILHIDELVKSISLNQTTVEYQTYQKTLQESKISILYGNFETGHDKIYQTVDLINQEFLPHDPRIIMDTNYDSGTKLLTVNGAVYKHSLNSRDKVSFHLFDANQQIVELNTHTTKYGDYQIVWKSNVEPGLYLAEIRHGAAKESYILPIQEEVKMVFTQNEFAMMEIANMFENLEGFVQKFSKPTPENHLQKMQLLMNKIKQDLVDGQSKPAAESIQKFKNNIKLYLPIQSPQIVIDSSITENTVKITGKVEKLVEYREPIFLSIFDQQGKRIHEQMAHDDKYGNINIEIPKRMIKGFAVVQIEYHDYLARDIVEVLY